MRGEIDKKKERQGKRQLEENTDYCREERKLKKFTMKRKSSKNEEKRGGKGKEKKSRKERNIRMTD